VGAIYIDAEDSSTMILNSIFQDNIAYAFGAAVYAFTSLTVGNCRFINNTYTG
jgi:hypothetical protein